MATEVNSKLDSVGFFSKGIYKFERDHENFVHAQRPNCKYQENCYKSSCEFIHESSSFLKKGNNMRHYSGTNSPRFSQNYRKGMTWNRNKTPYSEMNQWRDRTYGRIPINSWW